MAEHTPTPWGGIGNYPEASFIYKDGYVIAHCTAALHSNWIIPNPLGTERAKANAEFIVRAVNCHDELVAALERAIDDREPETVDDQDWLFAALAVLKKAKDTA